MASGIYNIWKSEILKSTVDLVNDTLKIALLDSNHAFAASSTTNDTWSDVSANEITGTGYTAGGKTLTAAAVTVDNSGNKGVFDADDVSWTSATFNADHAVIYDDTVVSPADMLICSFDFGGNKAVTSGTFSIVFSTDGIIAIA